jgi:DNA-directed RNA polymerase specialized sigma24 family protein
LLNGLVFVRPSKKTNKMSESDNAILNKLDKILRVLAISATKGMKQREQIALLNQAGLKPKEIADLLGTSSNTVRVELVALRKNSNKRKRKDG